MSTCAVNPVYGRKDMKVPGMAMNVIVEEEEIATC